MSNAFGGGIGGGSGPAGKSKAEQKRARIQARLAEQKRKNAKAGFKDEGADDAYDLSNALKKAENKHSFRSADYWKDKCDMVMEEIETEHQGAPVTRNTMVKIIEKCAHEYTSNLIKSLDSDDTPSMRELWNTILRERNADQPRYIAGDWVEFLDDDMHWKLGKVVKAAFREVEDIGAQGQMIPYDLHNHGDDEEEVSRVIEKYISVGSFIRTWYHHD